MLDNFVEAGRIKRESSTGKFRTSVNSNLTHMTRSGVKEDHTASYFSHDNAEANRRREQLAHDSLEMLIQWLKDGGNVGIHGM